MLRLERRIGDIGGSLRLEEEISVGGDAVLLAVGARCRWLLRLLEVPCVLLQVAAASAEKRIQAANRGFGQGWA
jgi:hypothetical protein